jgi:hypothetical protein
MLRGILLMSRPPLLCEEGNNVVDNYFNYFTEIERFYQSKRKSWTLVTCLDFVLMETWKERGVPLEIVLKGIDRAFSRAKREITHLAYCVKAVEEVLTEQKELTVEAPKLPDFNAGEVTAYLNKLADQVAVCDNAIAESIRNIDPADLRDAEQTLSALEEKLIAKLKTTASDNKMVQMKREIDNELNPFRSKMTAPQLLMLEHQMWRRKLLESANLPRLSLFYLI